MGKWTIAKEFDFCYGHRVHNQTLNSEYSIDNRCVCRHLHGHQGKVIVRLSSDTLNSGMVTDFKHLNWFKKFIDDVLDHKFIIDRGDPMFDTIVPSQADIIGWKVFPEGYNIVDLEKINYSTQNGLIEILEGFVVVNFVPTSENLSKWLFGIVEQKMAPLGIQVDSVHFYETPKSSSQYEQ